MALTRIFWRFQQTSLMLMLRSNVTQQRLKNLLQNKVQTDKCVVSIIMPRKKLERDKKKKRVVFLLFKPTCAQDEGRTSKRAGSQGTAGRAERGKQPWVRRVGLFESLTLLPLCNLQQWSQLWKWWGRCSSWTESRSCGGAAAGESRLWPSSPLSSPPWCSPLASPLLH